MRPHRPHLSAAILVLALASPSAQAELVSSPPGIDLEVYDPTGGGNHFEVEVGEELWAHLWLRPGPGVTSCTASCGSVLGGSSRLSSGFIRLRFDANLLTLVDAELNSARLDAAGEGVLDRRHAEDGILGWTLSGDWSPDGEPRQGALENPCQALVLEEDDWLLRIRLRAEQPGLSEIAVVGRPQFPLSFADLCNSPAFTREEGIDEVVPATVRITERGSGPCVPEDTVLCIDAEPGDGRFRITVSYETALGGGVSGEARAVSLAPLGMTQGGLFWFFDQANPEVLIKVLDGCGINGFFWVFFSAGTTVGLEVTVTDTFTDATWELQNPDGRTAPSSSDIQAFACP